MAALPEVAEAEAVAAGGNHERTGEIGALNFVFNHDRGDS